MRTLLAALWALLATSVALGAGSRSLLEPETEIVCEGPRYGSRLPDGDDLQVVWLADGRMARCIGPDGGATLPAR